MPITAADIAILAPVFRTPEKDLQKFFQQILRLDTVPHIFFVYEENGCNFDFSSMVENWCMANEVTYSILTLNGRLGLGFALNAAVAKIEQDFVMRHDLGDDFLENRVYDVLKSLNTFFNVDILYSQAILSDGNSEKTSKYARSEKELKRSFALGNPICHPTVVFRREAILRIGNYNPSLRFCEDLDLWLRAIRSGLRFYCLDVETIRYYTPERVRVSFNWNTNLSVRLKNFGSPNFAYSALGIVVILIFNILPEALRNKLYKLVK